MGVETPCGRSRRLKSAKRIQAVGRDGRGGPEKKKTRTVRWHNPGHKSGNDLLSRDLTSYYHWLLGA